MKNLTLALLLAILPTITHTQPILEWQNALGGNSLETAHSIQPTNDGGCIVAGFALSNNNGDVQGVHGGGDVWVVKLSQAGDIQWQKAVGGGSTEVAYAVQQTTDGGYIVAGKTYSNNGDVSGNHGDLDYWVVKLSANGSIEWQKTLGGSSRDEGNSIHQTSDGGYIVAGNSVSNDGDVTGNHGYYDFWVVKLSSMGEIEWQRSIGGGNGADIAYFIQQTTDDGYIVCGESNSTNGDVSGNHGDTDFWVVKLNSSGDIIWQKSLGGIGIDAAYSAQQTLDGGYIVVGTTGSGNTGQVWGVHGGFDIWVVKLSANGDLQWQKALGGSNEDYGSAVIQSANGNYIVAGSILSNNGDVQGNNGGFDIWVVTLNQAGQIKSQKTFGGTQSEFVHSIEQSNDGGLIVAGSTESNDGDVSGNHGEADFWVVKLSSLSSSTSVPQTLPLQISPNPTQQSITLNIPTLSAVVSTEAGQETNLTISITNLLGQQLHQQILSNDETINTADLPNGAYLINATTSSGKIYTGKFIKQD